MLLASLGPRSAGGSGGSGGSSRAGEPRWSKNGRPHNPRGTGARNLKATQGLFHITPPKGKDYKWYISGIFFCQVEDGLIQLMGKLVGFSCKNPKKRQPIGPRVNFHVYEFLGLRIQPLKGQGRV